MKNIFIAIILFSSLPFLFGQTPTVDLSLTPTQLVEDVLAGPGVIISNAKFNDNPNYAGNRIGKFTYTGSQISFPSGIVIGSGGVSNGQGTANGMIGPNSSGGYNLAGTGNTVSNDVQLKALDVQNQGLFDIGRLEFDFVPAGNKIKFDFIFGSDEYNEYVCSGFYDVFGFFVTGPNPAGGNYTNQNFALVPGTNLPISINTINNGSVGSSSGAIPVINPLGSCTAAGLANSQHFSGAPGAHFQMDGATKSLTIEFDVTCGETYHFKFAIADVGDANYDSWVFLKAGSFASEEVQVSVATVSGESTIIEGCSTADIIFTRPLAAADTAMTVHYEVYGSAIEGVDYDSLPNPIVFQPGQDSLILSLIPIQDNIDEGTDSVIIRVFIVNSCGDTIISEGTIYIVDGPDIVINEIDPVIYCANDTIPIYASASGGKSPYTYEWYNLSGDTISHIDTAYVKTGLNGPFEYYVKATDACGFNKTDTVTITLNQTLKIDTLISLPTKACLNTGTASAVVSGITGNPVYTWTASDLNNTTISTTTLAQNLGSGWYHFTVEDNICSLTDSIFVDAINAPIAVIVPDKTEGCNPTTFVLSNESSNANSYQWNTGSGYYSVYSKEAQSVTLSSNQYIYLIASDGTCSDTARIALTIVNCGCTDPLALNYDLTAALDDGSCMYHDPVIELPNIFTPNGDNVNELYEFTKMYVSEIEYWIFNRWGNQMYYTNKLDEYWNGKVNGTDASEGVYFIKYKAKGINGKELEGHTFFHLNR